MVINLKTNFFQRKFEELCIFSTMLLLLNGEFLGITIWIIWLIYGNFYLRVLWLLYLIFMIYDRNACSNNSRGQGFSILRKSSAAKYFTNYFPIKLEKTVDLPADRNYLMGIFPHGILSFGCLGNFASDTTNFKEKFPGIRAKICTLSFHLYCPLFRELLLGFGMLSASSSCISKVLMQSNDLQAPCNWDGCTSSAVIIVVGGAQEALNSRPGNYQLVLKNRKGFVKIAIQTGVSLVPIFSFGEVDIYNQKPNPPGSTLRKFQETFKKWTGIAPAFFVGNGFFLKNFGIIPFRKPITTVVGRPISVTQNSNPTSEEIEALHKKFTDELEHLFETNKHKYLKNADKIKLIIE